MTDDVDENETEDFDEPIPQAGVTVSIHGLTLYTYHGVTAAERSLGQRIIVDIEMDIGECDATVTDRIEDTVDYGEACQLAAEVAQERSYKTLERLSNEIAERLIDRFKPQDVTVRVAKPTPPVPFTVNRVAVELWREPDIS